MLGSLNLIVCIAAGLLSGQLVWLHWYLAGKGLTTFDYFNGLEQKEKQMAREQEELEMADDDAAEESPVPDSYGEEPVPEEQEVVDRKSEGEGDMNGDVGMEKSSLPPSSPSQTGGKLPPLKVPRKAEDKYALPGMPSMGDHVADSP